MIGHLKVTEIYDDHQNVVVDDHNMLTAGFGTSIIDVLTGEVGSIDYIKPTYLQLGTSAVGYPANAAGSSLFYHLSAPLSDITSYGDETCLEVYKLNRALLASSTDVTVDTPTYEEMLFVSSPLASITVSATTVKECFAKVEPQYKSKVFVDTLEVRLKLDKYTANGQVLTEFGLFAKNPFSYKEDRPFLLAYKKLEGSITKRRAFELLVEWSIGFLGNSKNIDTYSPGEY